MPTLLSIDCGTQSLRAFLFSRTGEILSRGQEPYEPCFSEHPGWAEQDPEFYWNCLDIQREWQRLGVMNKYENP